MQRVEPRQQVISQLRERFALLSEQYTSDIERLTSIAEVGARLGELKEECCPVCGALAEHHDVEHGEGWASPDVVALASVAESKKVHILLADLGKTIEDTADEAANLGHERTSLEGTLQEVTERLQRELRPNVRIALDDYKELHRERTSLDELLSLHSRLEQITSLRQAQENEKLEKSESIVTKVSVAETENLCMEIQTLFEEWQLPNADRVVFSEDAQDIVVSGRPRSSDGKGVRAITHSAFTIGLNNYCIQRKMPTSTVVIIDSPLVVYRKPDEGESDFTEDLKTNFYRTLGRDSIGRQVIVLENDEPPEDLDKTVNVIHFTKSDTGRYGLIPVRVPNNGSDTDQEED